MISGSTIKFLRDLKKNNNRDWFLKNKSRYEEAKKEFETFVDHLIKEISKFDKSVSGLEGKKCVFRIYRDVRFSKDKSPYKANFGAYIAKGGRKSEIHESAGYYIHLEPGASFLAGGAYMPPPEWLQAIRQEIVYQPKEFKKILSSPGFRKYFKTLDGEKLSRPPKGFDADDPEIEYLKHKSFLGVCNVSDTQVLSANFKTYAPTVFKALFPLNHFLNTAAE